VAVAPLVDVAIHAAWGIDALVPVLVSVRDPGNLGAIVRSADASGAGAVVLTSSSVDLYNPKVVRASAGSLFHLPIVLGIDEAVAVEACRQRGARVFAAAADGELSVYDADLRGPVAVLFGNEAHGLSQRTRSLADATLRVPIAGRAESLNLAAAAAVVLFEAARQRDRSVGGRSLH
jgi:TrmH family RNA methyltransferase